MPSAEGPSPTAPPFGACPRCHFSGPPLVTVVRLLLLFFTCTRCGFVWSVVPSYVGELWRLDEP
jgi:hypothetical protein